MEGSAVLIFNMYLLRWSRTQQGMHCRSENLLNLQQVLKSDFIPIRENDGERNDHLCCDE
jgi:hypothetical protein